MWRMLRSHHLAYKLYMRPKLRVSRYAGGRALVYGILGGGNPPRALSLLALGGGVRMAISSYTRQLKIKKLKTVFMSAPCINDKHFII